RRRSLSRDPLRTSHGITSLAPLARSRSSSSGRRDCHPGTSPRRATTDWSTTSAPIPVPPPDAGGDPETAASDDRSRPAYGGAIGRNTLRVLVSSVVGNAGYFAATLVVARCWGLAAEALLPSSRSPRS